MRALGLRGVPACLLAATAVVSAGQKPAEPVTLPVTQLSGSPSGQLPPAQPPPPPASAPSQQPASMPVTQLDERSRAFDLDAPHRVSIALTSPASIRDLLLLLVRDTPFSVAVDPDVQGSFIGELKDVSLRQGLESVLAPRDLDYDVVGSIIRVFPRRAETRSFDLNLLDVHRTWQRTVGSRGGVGPIGRDGSVLSSTSGDGHVFDDLTAGIGALLSPGGRVHVDRRAGLVTVTDYASRLDTVGLYVEALQARQSRQVRLQARILEVALWGGAGSINWRAVRGKLGLPPVSSSAGFPIPDPDVLQGALAAQGTVRLIAAPDVVAMNNEPTIMRVGTQDVSFVARTGAAKGERDSQPVAIMEGLTFTVVPQISADGIVMISVSPSWTERNGRQRSAAGHIVSVLNVSEADSVMRVSDGNTVMVAGFLRVRQESHPAGGFGGLFGIRRTTPVATETVVLLTPTVVTPGTYPGSRTR